MNSDTARLLKSCNLGCKYASSGMEHVLPFVKNVALKSYIEDINSKHICVGETCKELLHENGKTTSEPAALNMFASRIKRDFKLSLSPTAKTVASIMVDSCEMGIKDMCKALKNCPAADKESVDLVKTIIKTEQCFLEEMIEYY